ncbi:50S ribosomal protein L18e [Candidatus Woesearchaeota archaeon ex4484_78]|nr:MAG: 50S ribosomal protein L18e [Candidatus Woesearchaeota archaeon ex4484_78]
MKLKKTNQELVSVIRQLRLNSHKKKKSIWKAVAEHLEKPTRKKRVVNLSKINRFSKDGDLIIVPGKVLASGELTHKITIIAWSFSKEALRKIAESGSNPLKLKDIIEKLPDNKNMRIIC